MSFQVILLTGSSIGRTFLVHFTTAMQYILSIVVFLWKFTVLYSASACSQSSNLPPCISSVLLFSFTGYLLTNFLLLSEINIFFFILMFFTWAFLLFLRLFLGILDRWIVDTLTLSWGLASNFKSKSLSSLSRRTTKNIKTLITDQILKGSDNGV